MGTGIENGRAGGGGTALVFGDLLVHASPGSPTPRPGSSAPTSRIAPVSKTLVGAPSGPAGRLSAAARP